MTTGTYLDTILDHTRDEVARQRAAVPLGDLDDALAAAPSVRDFAAALRRAPGCALIAEVKKASPSRGVLLPNFDALALAQTYAANGAAAISVLTDSRFFQGSLAFLTAIRCALPAGPPLLRKDFIIDPYQVYQARAAGADALLLIVAALDPRALAELLALAAELGMQALVEVHDEAELDAALTVGAAIVGVNNRDLRSFATDLAATQRVAARLPARGRPLLVSESGIFTTGDVATVRSWGADAVLVGEALVTAPDIAAHVRELSGSHQEIQ